jgi:hypothetical protein
VRFMIRLWQKPTPHPSSYVRFAQQRFFRGLSAGGGALGIDKPCNPSYANHKSRVPPIERSHSGPWWFGDEILEVLGFAV